MVSQGAPAWWSRLVPFLSGYQLEAHAGLPSLDPPGVLPDSLYQQTLRRFVQFGPLGSPALLLVLFLVCQDGCAVGAQER
eukprot:SAG22_NODE_12559_length_438_cov_0.764012_1_plen_79_part_01